MIRGVNDRLGRPIARRNGGCQTGPDGLFSLAAGRTSPLSIGLHVAADVLHGTLVHLTASVGASQVRCRNVRTLDVPVLVQ